MQKKPHPLAKKAANEIMNMLRSNYVMGTHKYEEREKMRKEVERIVNQQIRRLKKHYAERK